MHLAYIWIVSHLSTKNYRNWWKFDEVLTKTNLLSFLGTRCRVHTINIVVSLLFQIHLLHHALALMNINTALSVVETSSTPVTPKCMSASVIVRCATTSDDVIVVRSRDRRTPDDRSQH